MGKIIRCCSLIALYVLSVVVVAAPAQAQSTPMIELVCDTEIKIDVYPGASRTGYTKCTASNPTSYIETVRITVSSDGLAYSSPGILTVGANDQSEFTVTVRGESRMEEQTRTVKISGTVTKANGLDNPTQDTVETSTMVVVNQFSRLQVEATEPFLQLQPKTDHPFEFKVYNQGNQLDKFRVGIDDESREDLEDAGFQISMPLVSVEIDSMAEPTKVRVLVRTPKNQGWTDEYHTLNFIAVSDFSCRHETTGCNYESQMITIYVRGVYLPGFEMIPTLSMVALAFAVAMRRQNLEEDEYGSETDGFLTA